jgi:hypothetical protein
VTTQRRAVKLFEALVVGGPADGLRLACERMSDGEIKVLAGLLFDDGVAGMMASHYFDSERGVIVYAGEGP